MPDQSLQFQMPRGTSEFRGGQWLLFPDDVAYLISRKNTFQEQGFNITCGYDVKTYQILSRVRSRKVNPARIRALHYDSDIRGLLHWSVLLLLL
jgi:hypothetical protein